MRSASEQFDDIAFLYDEVMAGVPYAAWVDYIERILARFKQRPRRVLDLCCGTGSVSIRLARKGYEVVGVDVSAAMVAIAREKARRERLHLTFYDQDAGSLSIGRRFDLVISLFDSLNYIVDAEALQETFRRTANHLDSSGLFIFDVNTELAFAAGLFDQDNVGSGRGVEHVWRSSYDPASRLCRIRMVFEYKLGDSPRRIEVMHLQRAYDQEEIVDMLSRTGFTTLAVYDAYAFREASKGSDRIFFVAAKDKPV